MNALSAVLPLVVGLFGGAAGAALVTGMFNRPKVHADTVTALASVDYGAQTTDANVTEIIQRAAGGLVADMERQLSELRRRLDDAERKVGVAQERASAAERCAARSEARADEADRWRQAAEQLFTEQGLWERDLARRLRRHNIEPPPSAPALRPPPPTPHEGITR